MRFKDKSIFIIIIMIMMIFSVVYAVDNSGANPPDLYGGALKPIMFNESTGETIRLKLDADGITVTDEHGNSVEWYNYDEKKWANAVTVDESDNITGYFVWIPRYAYSINSGYHTSNVGIKKILFLQGTTNKDQNGIYHSALYESVQYIGDRQQTYLVHPAFNFNGNISGFWMAKFEASSSDNNIRILPGATAWKMITIGDAFDKSMAMKDSDEYGLIGSDADTHLVKNIEWGAMSYLTSSRHGKGSKEVWINNYYPRVTGMGSAISASEKQVTQKNQHLVVDYKTPVNGMIQQSTTGNIYGIYDTNGGLWEYVAGYINTRDQYDNTIDSVAEIVIVKNGNGLLESNYKYKDLYQRSSNNADSENYNLASVRKGDGVWETSTSWNSDNSDSWFMDYSRMPNTNMPFFARGGCYSLAQRSGIYSFMATNGIKQAVAGFRVSISKNI